MELIALLFSAIPICGVSIGVASIVWWVLMMVRVTQLERDDTKPMWLIITLFGGFVGGFIYWGSRVGKYKALINDLLIFVAVFVVLFALGFTCSALTMIVPMMMFR